MKKLILACGFSLIAALATSGAAIAQQPAVLKFAFASPPTTNWLPYFVAKKKGWLADAGLDVQETWLTSDPNALRALLSKQADLAAVGVFPPYAAVIEGAKIKAIGSFLTRVDYEIVARSNIKTLKDLEGARIGTSSPGAASGEIPRLVMRKNGFDPAKATVVPVGSHEARMMAIAADKIDAAAIPTLFAAKAIKMPGMHSLANVAKEFPEMGHLYILAQDADLQDPAKRAMFGKFMTAVIEGSRFIVANPEESAKIMREYLPEFDETLLVDAIKVLSANDVWAVNGGAEPEISEFTIKVAVDLKAITKSIAVGDILDQSIVKPILDKLGRR